MEFKQINRLDQLYGCKLFLTKNELQDLKKTAFYQSQNRFIEITKPIKSDICQRCFNKIKINWKYPKNGIKYCWYCKDMGTIRSNDYLVIIKDPKQYLDNSKINWKGQLTLQQQKIANEQLIAWERKLNHLTYAVTGSGKTEILYPLINQVLLEKGRIALVAPRVDVVIELSQRIKKYFNGSMTVLHGEEHEIKYTQLLICTVQQLMKFHQTFDLIVVDEVDAFPLRNNKALEKVIEEAKRPQGVKYYLTATPSINLLRRVKHTNWKLSFLANRFHGYPLPIIQIYISPKWRKKLPIKIEKQLSKYQKNKRCFLIFVPQIEDLNLVKAMMPKSLSVATVYSKHPERSNNIKKLRSREINGLITTTILERGVTFSALDVYILGGDEVVFTYETILQIAGRCGRDAEYPNGNVWIFTADITLRMLRAKKEIQWLNSWRDHHSEL
ncbi:DEAD/DEAH box helicase [Weissella koreensis]|uniref:DEAD/DEAH box helicase n=1 Tax=Weissella koreensis TaxID=165096 RepID=A0A7H1MMI4_9LACO|nr:DEAD/DEAH box helicase [Weissella koreensis]AVH75468.1 ATP-dependent DNA helicase [Weissella koreensis]EJF34446.1 hypothetical protein JC2156_12860 [Weissella koreensis KCTC 3621]QGN20691.1 DEAD/DEAH box helicase [Weissella koreensis]QNT64670.1 DEAD/DEAH box helicase [Weissella koreensis]